MITRAHSEHSSGELKIMPMGSFKCHLLVLLVHNHDENQGPVVQSTVSLTSWLRLVKGHFANCFSGFNIQYSDIFC